ncbi:hypothetical protein CLAFUW4_13312 [Fulvia fulva]|uniref:Uncharacterized protein n=1 Tax=Passalora fulva TaxID=5499 RepID=A0A9Q8PJQ6_PASFU|nr:uncharacterized protein CLAFUR5_13166 [Fulvia fulva]KAK4611728.1 hypothetical protein CLAFUR4_13317 [Fulvia fulva]UJO23692.1 hypothetical protein CLAFUR5_13166 [Fulvia fulva]WPV20892.1 hypothetical protein CLAFUW4_13312 [Fulvia fulva]WPV36013.1 hypothetical protein CLAFUW7_13319 [Fulvia fulva]
MASSALCNAGGPSKTDTATEQRKGLLDLPAEIWSKIGKIVIADSNHLSATAFWESPKHPDFYHQPPIPRTCRILREEPLPQFYSTRVHIHCANFSRITVWLRRIGPELRRCLRGTVVLRSLFESEEHFRQRLMRTLGVELELDTTPTGLNPVIWHNTFVANSRRNGPVSLTSRPRSCQIGKHAIDNERRVCGGGLNVWKSTYHQPPITRTCRLLREELLPYFYSTKVLITCGADDEELGLWLRTIGPENRRAIVGIKRATFCPGGMDEESEYKENWGVELKIEMETLTNGIKQLQRMSRIRFL